MATIGGNNMTLMDVARMTGPDGKLMKIAEILTQTNAILEDMPFVECNNGMTNVATIRTGLPEGTWRKLYGGVQAEKGTTQQISDSCGMLETYSEPDKALIDMAPDKGAALLREAKVFLAGMAKTMASTLFYGNVAQAPEKFEGLATRFAKYGGVSEEVSAFNVLNGGGTGSTNTSIWLVSWGEDTISGLYPRGSQAGLRQNDMGEVTVTKNDGSKYQAYRTHYKWDMGLAVFDWRYVVRVANIDVTKLTGAGTSGYTGSDLINLLIEAIGHLPDDAKGNRAIYCNRAVHTALNKLAANKANLALSIEEFAGKKIPAFWGVPIKRCDGILNTEAAVPAA